MLTNIELEAEVAEYLKDYSLNGFEYWYVGALEHCIGLRAELTMVGPRRRVLLPRFDGAEGVLLINRTRDFLQVHWQDTVHSPKTLVWEFLAYPLFDTCRRGRGVSALRRLHDVTVRFVDTVVNELVAHIKARQPHMYQRQGLRLRLFNETVGGVYLQVVEEPIAL